MGIAGGAGLLGIYMLVCGFFQPGECERLSLACTCTPVDMHLHLLWTLLLEGTHAHGLVHASTKHSPLLTHVAAWGAQSWSSMTVLKIMSACLAEEPLASCAVAFPAFIAPIPACSSYGRLPPAVDVMPKPVWTYPLHYISFHSYTFYGFMQNEFENTDVSGAAKGHVAHGAWCACARVWPGGEGCARCVRITCLLKHCGGVKDRACVDMAQAARLMRRTLRRAGKRGVGHEGSWEGAHCLQQLHSALKCAAGRSGHGAVAAAVGRQLLHTSTCICLPARRASIEHVLCCCATKLCLCLSATRSMPAWRDSLCPEPCLALNLPPEIGQSRTNAPLSSSTAGMGLPLCRPSWRVP